MLETLKLFNDEIAIVFEGMQYSGNQIASIIRSTANQLLTSGVKPGDIIAIQNNNSLEHFASSISIALLGATAVSQSHTQSNEAIREQNDLVKTQWIFASENQQPQAYQKPHQKSSTFKQAEQATLPSAMKVSLNTKLHG